MDFTQWADLKRHLELLLDNDARVFTTADLQRFADFIEDPVAARGARHIAEKLASRHITGDLYAEFARRFSDLLGVRLPPAATEGVGPADLDQWVTVADATTMARPFGVPFSE